jgi:peroxiredoxin
MSSCWVQEDIYMRWINLSGSENSIRAPYFRLLSASGEPYHLDQFRGRYNLILFFGHSLQCPACYEMLRQFSVLRDDYLDRNAKVLSIWSQDEALIMPTKKMIDFPIILLDDQQITRRLYYDFIASEDRQDAMIFVMDRFGSPFAAAVGDEFDITIHDEILNWLDFIELQCPE